MSQENVAVVRRMFEHYSSGDVEKCLDHWSPNAEWTEVGYGAVEGQPRVYRAHVGLRRFFADALETFAEIRVQPAEFRDAGKLVLVLGELVAKGATSEAPFAASMGWLFEVEGGMVVRGRDYLDQREALEAAGLRE